MNMVLRKLRKVHVFALLFGGLCIFWVYRINNNHCNCKGNTKPLNRNLRFDYKESNYQRSSDTVTLHKLYTMLDDLDATIQEKAPENMLYGNIYSKKRRKQVESYVSTITKFLKTNSIKTICEIGFAGGHSATVFLYLTESASYTAFDMWDRPAYENAAYDWVTSNFKTRDIRLIKGDSTKTVPQFEGKCDLIHIDGAHHAHFPLNDMKNMMRLASSNNLLLLDDCTDSWPAVLKGVDYLKANDLVNSLNIVVDEGWIFRNRKKGWCIGSYKAPVQNISFFGKIFCAPSWYGDKCENQLIKPCSKLSDKCFYNNETGVLSVSCNRWQEAQASHKIAWDKSLTYNYKIEAYAKAFDFYRSLRFDLGDVIELRTGPVTHLQAILKDRKASSITIVEPMAFEYMAKEKQCDYQNGHFKDIPTTIQSMITEELNFTRKFDTLVMVNVIENAYDALSTLSFVVNLIKDGGLIIWHERLWDDYQGVANSDNDVEFKFHPIRIKTPIAKHFISIFEKLYLSWETEALDGLKNQGVYFIGQKRGSIAITSSPQHPSCFPQLSGKQTLVIFVSSLNYTTVMKSTNAVQTASKIGSVIVFLVETMSKEPLDLIMAFPKLNTIISHHHIHNWYQELSYHTSPCSQIVESLSLAVLSSSETICMGRNTSFTGVTMVLMGYSIKRLKNYDYILPSYTKMEMIEKIIMIWNNKSFSFPEERYSHPKITFIYPESNSLNNRFNVSQYIDSDAVLYVDDDVLVSESLVISLFKKWSENMEKIIGFAPDARYVTKNKEYRLIGQVPSIALTKTMMLHKKYLEKYMRDNILVDWNKNKFSCEDISMNGVVFKETGLKPIFVKKTGKHDRKNLQEGGALSLSGPSSSWWGEFRTQCVRYVMQHFNISF